MPGTIQWNATYTGGGPHPSAEIYDAEEQVVQSKYVPCKPPINCAFSMNDLPFGEYTAALVSGSDHYYFVGGEGIISAPNQSSEAQTLVLTEDNPTASVTINVQPE
ncbi:MAG: hypothetical protein HY708_07740 [Ignavibacteriae bacterium]|nr:hypothetical protein [Ignavibacteriota bacterium]